MAKCIDRHVVLPNIHEVLPDAKVLLKEKVQLRDQMPALLAFVDFPQGGLMMNADTGERFDSARGFLIFFKECDLVILSYQSDLEVILNSEIQKEKLENRRDKYLSVLLETANSFQTIK